MASKCFPVVRGSVARITRLDACGRPVYGECSRVVTDGVISVALTANFVESDAINVTNFAGKTCVSVPATNQFQNYTVAITFCNVDPELFSIVSGQDTITDPFTGDTIGYETRDDVDATQSSFALELWSLIPGQACSEQGEVAAGYVLLPFIQGGVFGDKTLENGALNFQLTNAQTKAGSGWGSGPYNVMFDANGDPAPLNKPIGPRVHERVMYVEVAPPTPMCGCQPLNQPAMDFTSTVTGDQVSLEFTGTATTPEDPGFVSIDWGDGTPLEIVPVTSADATSGDWTEGPTTHTYDDPDTYDISATYYSIVRRHEAVIASS